nr:reverse transcriptase domain-containing protein [Tanacetum cinerariifolium]
MSSPTYPIIIPPGLDVEDTFSSTNTLDYTLASPDYFPASPGNTSSSSENGLIPLAISSSHYDSYMHAIQAYDANNNEPLIPPHASTVPPTVLPSSPILSLSPMFDPQYFFLHEEIMPPRKRAQFLSLSSTDLSAQSQAFKIRENYHGALDTSYTRHEEQIEDILNDLDELSLDHIEEIEGHDFYSRTNHQGYPGSPPIRYEESFWIQSMSSRTAREDHHHQATRLDPMPPKRTSTSAAPAMTQVGIRQLVADSVVAALEAQAANMVNTDNTNRNPEPKETFAARKCTYKEFMSCQPFYFNGTEGAVGLIRWFEQTELVFSRSNCTEDCKVKFATGILTEDALSWWNSYAKPIGIEQANKIAWIELKRLLTNKYCPRTEVRKMEDEFCNLVVKGNDIKTYARRF